MSQLPIYYALSYVWGEPAKPQEIFIDGKRMPITQNLYDGLRALQKSGFGTVRVWADALCICQEDKVERSAQILLMREVYHAAYEVIIWLGSNSEDGKRVFTFIGLLTGADDEIDDPTATEDDKIEENVYKSIMRPIGAFVRGGFRVGQVGLMIGDVVSPAGLDDKAEILIDPDAEYSLNQVNTLNADWRPSARRLAKVSDYDFPEMAVLVSRIFTQNEWFSRMWVVQVGYLYSSQCFYSQDLISHQEIGVAGCESSPVFHLGGMRMDWDNAFKAISYLHYAKGIAVEGIRR